MMRFLWIYCFIAVSCFGYGQDKKEDPDSWTTQVAYTHQYIIDSLGGRWSDFQGFGVRFISPNFKIETDGEYWTEEKEKNAGKFKKARFFFEIMYAPKYHKVDLVVTEFSGSADLMYSLLHIKRFNLYAEGGMKLHFVHSSDYGLVNFKKVFYWDYGAAAQLDLGFVVPFIETRRFLYWTAGMEFRLHPVYKKPKRKYHIHRKRFPVS